MIAYMTGLLVLFVGHLSAGRLVDPACLQAPTPGVSALACCNIPNLLDGEVVERCVARVMNDKDSPMDMAYGMTQEDVLFSPGIRCISECILTETNITTNRCTTDEPIPTTSDGIRQFDLNATLAATRANVAHHYGNESAWLPVLELALHRCNAIIARMRFEEVPHDECDMAPVFFMACLDTQMFRECPVEVWQNEYGCDQLRQQAAQCPVLSAVLINHE